MEGCDEYTHFMSQVQPAAQIASTKPKQVNRGWFEFGGTALPKIMKTRDEMMTKLRKIHGKVTNSMDQDLKDLNKQVKDGIDMAKSKWKAFQANQVCRMNTFAKSAWVAIRVLSRGDDRHHVKLKRIAMKLPNGKNPKQTKST